VKETKKRKREEMKLQAVLRGAKWVKAVKSNTKSDRLPKETECTVQYTKILCRYIYNTDINININIDIIR